MQTPSDCKVNQCDGNGGVMSVNANDPIVDGNQCTDDVCTAGVPSNPPSMAGAPCNQMSGAVCSGSGTCVQCVTSADCAATTGGACSMFVCQAPTCTDGIKNNGEGDIDCGGACPMQCVNGKTCNADSDCTSGACLSNVCSVVNGCDMTTATDYTMMAPPPITFANGNFTYAPKCIKVKAGAMLTFNGNFVSHPLLGGVVAGGMAIPAMSGPFVPVTSTGTTKTFTMSSVGTFPYYCVAHAVSQNMDGVVFVVP
jgi:plastocyanin